jgi:enhancing lycopene biosynthesis protein 2
MSKKIAVILCGSGYKDGSEIRESVGALWALSAMGAQVRMFAPDQNQYDVVNCFTDQPMPAEKRNSLVEAARIARGQIEPLSRLQPSELDGVIVPGGFGVAKNLCTFALQGSQGVVLPEVKRALQTLREQHKPIGAICIAPALVALTFPRGGFKLTLGAHGEAAQEIEKLGHTHQVCVASECVVDVNHRIVTTPAYMYDDAPLFEVFQGIQKLVQNVVELARS